MSTFFTSEEGYFAMTKAGYIALVVIVVIAIALTALVTGNKQKKDGSAKKISARQLAFCGSALALAFVVSSVPFLKIHLPMGGAVTLFSMFLICFIGYLYGIRIGLLTAFAYSLLQFWDGASYVLSPFQACCDYILAFTALGIAGLWMGKKNGMMIGYIVGCLIRGLFHSIGGYLYWMDYMPETFPQSLAAIYPLVYNYSFILAEMVLTLIVINLPPVKKAIGRVAAIATE
ncbi:MAG: energy-coupled thiamine transporter ThiT [Lachnospiraceae bacterium]|nr:energy-coupled thiamine transporter ThiT [Lachnospiraceae bacterium]